MQNRIKLKSEKNENDTTFVYLFRGNTIVAMVTTRVIQGGLLGNTSVAMVTTRVIVILYPNVVLSDHL